MNKELKTVKPVRLTEKEIEKIKAYGEIKGLNFSESVRSLIQKGLTMEMTTDNMDLINKLIEKNLKEIIEIENEKLINKIKEIRSDKINEI